MNWFVETFREYPSLAIFLTIGVGFWIGKLKYKSFSLGTVTSVLLVGVLVGQMGIEITGPLKSVFFLLFLFAIGYNVGPQFFSALRGDGIKQVIFACVLCVVCLLVTWGIAVAFGYNPGEAAGLLSGAQTISAVIGVGGGINENVDVLLLIFLIVCHKLCESLTLDKLGNNCPLAVNHINLENLWNIKSQILNSCLIESLVKHVSLGILCAEHFNTSVTVTVDGLIISYCDYSVKIHCVILL